VPGQGQDFFNIEILSSMPPYEKIDKSQVLPDAVILSIHPRQLSRGDYELAFVVGGDVHHSYKLKLRYEFTAPWDY
jgi:hypothetical protein